MGRPAASADVHFDGRSALDLRSKVAPEPAVGAPLCQCASYSSYSTQVSRLSMMAWRSPSASWPPSIGVSAPNGYGPASLSSPYSHDGVTSGWLPSTTVQGMP